MKALLIAGQGAIIAKSIVNTTTNKILSPKIQDSVCTDPTIGLRLNALNVINNTMKGMLAQKQTGTLDAEPVICYTVSRVVDFIHNGTPLYWMANGGKQLDGTEVRAEELELWREFYQYYGQLTTNIAFKDLKSIIQVGGNNYRNVRFAITNDTKMLSDTVTKLWELVKAEAANATAMTEMADEDVI